MKSFFLTKNLWMTFISMEQKQNHFWTPLVRRNVAICKSWGFHTFSNIPWRHFHLIQSIISKNSASIVRKLLAIQITPSEYQSSRSFAISSLLCDQKIFLGLALRQKRSRWQRRCLRVTLSGLQAPLATKMMKEWHHLWPKQWHWALLLSLLRDSLSAALKMPNDHIIWPKYTEEMGPTTAGH